MVRMSLWIVGALVILGVCAWLLFVILQTDKKTTIYSNSRVHFWRTTSIDTSKYSRDLAREKLNDSSFDTIIEEQVRNIAETGATHVSINTPYDEEFVPYLTRWVEAARRHNINVWFRGNWSGWEEWFDYQRIFRDEHISKTEKFILAHRDLFKDGDIFTPCPECENGGPGDPRHNNDVVGHREFLIKEYSMTKSTFEVIGKSVRSNYNSMNADVARVVMDPLTTSALGGVVAVDHYVESPIEFARDVAEIATSSKGDIVVGEFGAPIPDIHGSMSAATQAAWIESALFELTKMPHVVGVNYWTAVGGSTEIWNSKMIARLAVDVLKNFYKPLKVNGFVKDELDRPIANAKISTKLREIRADQYGYFELPYYPKGDLTIEVEASGHSSTNSLISKPNQQFEIILVKTNKSMFDRFFDFIRL
ncbi:MAG: carboxypeptidase-like regulatory domain-containing protein [Patescibacteria group bacterium]